MVIALLCQDASEIEREGAGADAAARADHTVPRLLLGRGLDDIYLLQLLGAIEGRDQGFLGDWLDEVVAGAGIDDVTVDGDIVHRSDADDLGAVREGRAERSEERRGGKEGVSTCRSRWSPYH